MSYCYIMSSTLLLRLVPPALLFLVLLSGCGPSIQVLVQEGSPASTTADAGEVRPNDGNAVGKECAYATSGECFTEGLLRITISYLTFVAEFGGALVIGVAVVRGLLRYIPHIFGRQRTDDQYAESIRLQLGKSLALALEFELGADILKTAIAPTLAIIAQLAAIAILRTFLNYFLEQELRQAEQRRARGEDAMAVSARASGTSGRQES